MYDYAPVLALLLTVLTASNAFSQAHAVAPPPPPGAKNVVCKNRPIPQLVDITAKTGIKFTHTVRSGQEVHRRVDGRRRACARLRSRRLAGHLLHQRADRRHGAEGTDAPAARSTTTTTTAPSPTSPTRRESRRRASPWAGPWATTTMMAGPTWSITCLGHTILYRNNGDGTFTDVTKQAGIDDPRWSTGAAFGDYDNDGFVDLMVSRYVDFQLERSARHSAAARPASTAASMCSAVRAVCEGAGDSLYHNNGDGTFTDVSKAAGVDDPRGYYGLGVVWADFNNTGRPDIYVANDSTPNYLYKQRWQRQVHRHRSGVGNGGERRRLRAGLDGHRDRRLQPHRTAVDLRHQLRRRIQHSLPQRGRLRFPRCLLRGRRGGGVAALGEVGQRLRRSRQRRLARPDLGQRTGVSAGGSVCPPARATGSPRTCS